MTQPATQGAPWGSPRRTALADRSLRVALAALCAALAVGAGVAPTPVWGVAAGGVCLWHALGRAPSTAALAALALGATALLAGAPSVAPALGACAAAGARLALLRGPAGGWLARVHALARHRRAALIATGLCTGRDPARAGDHYEDAGRRRRELREAGLTTGRGDAWLRIGTWAAALLAAAPGDAIGAVLTRWRPPGAPAASRRQETLLESASRRASSSRSTWE